MFRGLAIALALSAVITAVWLATRGTDALARAPVLEPLIGVSPEPDPRLDALAAGEEAPGERQAARESVVDAEAPDLDPGAVIRGRIELTPRALARVRHSRGTPPDMQRDDYLRVVALTCDVVAFAVGENGVPTEPVVRARVDPSGAFEIELDAPRATWLLVESRWVGCPVTRRVDFGDLDRVDVGRVEIGEGLSIAGRLTVDGAPVSAGMLFAELSADEEAVQIALPSGRNERERRMTWVRGVGFAEPDGGARLDADGCFEIVGLAGALYSLRHADMRPEERVVARAPASGIEIRLAREPFVALVRLDGRPVAGARVRFDGAAGFTSGDGRAALAVRPRARGPIVVEPPGLPETTAARDPARGSPDAPQVVELEPGDTQPGRIVALFDDPAFAGAVRVELIGKVEGKGWSLRADVPVVEGAFALEALPIGKFEMWVQPPASGTGGARCLVAQRHFVTTAAGTDTEVGLVAVLGGWVEIEVGSTWRARTVVWRDSAGPRTDLPTQLVTLDRGPEHLRYGFNTPLPPGTYELEMSGGNRGWTSPVTVAALRTTVLTADPRRNDDGR